MCVCLCLGRGRSGTLYPMFRLSGAQASPMAWDVCLFVSLRQACFGFPELFMQSVSIWLVQSFSTNPSSRLEIGTCVFSSCYCECSQQLEPRQGFLRGASFAGWVQAAEMMGGDSKSPLEASIVKDKLCALPVSLKNPFRDSVQWAYLMLSYFEKLHQGQPSKDPQKRCIFQVLPRQTYWSPLNVSLSGLEMGTLLLYLLKKSLLLTVLFKVGFGAGKQAFWVKNLSF